MWKYTVEVNGMMCGMCEAHVNDAVRKACPVKKVSSSRSKNQTNRAGHGGAHERHSRHGV